MFSRDEQNMIYADQINALESVHCGERCGNVSECPPEHFGFDVDTGDVFMRQEVIKKILDKANKEEGGG